MTAAAGPTVAVVTGANRGLGHALAGVLVERPGTCVVMAVRDLAAAEPCRQLVDGVDRQGFVVHLDYQDERSIEAAAEEVADRCPRVDLLVNCGSRNVAAGHPREASKGPLGRLEGRALEQLLRVNAIGPVLTCQAFLPLLKRSPAPRIVNVSTARASLARTRDSASFGYALSKAALNMATRKMAEDLRAAGGVMLAVDPGWLRTRMGGPEAPGDPRAAAQGIVEQAFTATPERSGSFLGHDGSVIPW